MVMTAQDPSATLLTTSGYVQRVKPRSISLEIFRLVAEVTLHCRSVAGLQTAFGIAMGTETITLDKFVRALSQLLCRPVRLLISASMLASIEVAP
jgi:hypothetical protein